MQKPRIFRIVIIVGIVIILCTIAGCTTFTSVKTGDFGSRDTPAGGVLVTGTTQDNTRLLITETPESAAPETTTLKPVIVSPTPSPVTTTPTISPTVTTLTPATTRTLEYTTTLVTTPVTSATPTPTITQTTTTTLPISTTPTVTGTQYWVVVTPTCHDGLTLCSGYCVNLQKSVTNCGACGHTCTVYPHGTSVCTQGKCDYSCTSGYVKYSGGCSLPPN